MAMRFNWYTSSKKFLAMLNAVHTKKCWWEWENNIPSNIKFYAGTLAAMKPPATSLRTHYVPLERKKDF